LRSLHPRIRMLAKAASLATPRSAATAPSKASPPSADALAAAALASRRSDPTIRGRMMVRKHSKAVMAAVLAPPPPPPRPPSPASRRRSPPCSLHRLWTSSRARALPMRRQRTCSILLTSCSAATQLPRRWRSTPRPQGHLQA
jgi:hypothetical protein